MDKTARVAFEEGCETGIAPCRCYLRDEKCRSVTTAAPATLYFPSMKSSIISCTASTIWTPLAVLHPAACAA